MVPRYNQRPMLPYRAELSYPEWFTAVDRRLVEEALTKHAAPPEHIIEPGIFILRWRYPSEAAALEAVVAVYEVIASIIKDHARDDGASIAIRLRDDVIAWADPKRPTPSIDLREFRQGVQEELETRAWWPVQAPTPPATSTPSIGEQLQRLRKKAGLSEKVLADLMEMDKSDVHDHLHGTVIPSYKKQLEYEAVFRTVLDQRVRLKRI